MQSVISTILVTNGQVQEPPPQCYYRLSPAASVLCPAHCAQYGVIVLQLGGGGGTAVTAATAAQATACSCS